MFRSVFLIDHILEGTKCFSTPTMPRRRDDPSSMNVGITRLNEILAAVSKWQQVVRAIFSRWIRFAGCLASPASTSVFLLALQNRETIHRRRRNQPRLPPLICIFVEAFFSFLISFCWLLRLLWRIEGLNYISSMWVFFHAKGKSSKIIEKYIFWLHKLMS